MKTSKEFFDEVKNNPAFAEKINEELKARIDGSSADNTDLVLGELSNIATENGYEVSLEEINAVRASAIDELSEEDLGKVAGGTAISLAVTTVLSAITATSVSGTVVSVLATQATER